MSSDEAFIDRVITCFKLIKREIPEEAPVEGKERNFKQSLAQHLFEQVLGWTRVEGEGHYVVAEVKDIMFYDEGLFPVIIVETKSPDVELLPEHEGQLKGYLEAVGSARYGVLTNWHRFVLYEYDLKTGLRKIAHIDVDAAIEKSLLRLSQDGKVQILELKKLEKRRLVKLEDPEYFEKRYREIPILKDKEEGIKLLTQNLGKIIEYLTDAMERFFFVYRKRDAHHSGEFLDKALKDWLTVSGKERDWENMKKQPGIIEMFCRETAYVIIGRLLFTRVCEDKDITTQRMSGANLALWLSLRFRWGITGDEYLRVLEEIYDHIEEYYEHFYELSIFDWWKIEEREKRTLDSEEIRVQNELEKELNLLMRDALRKLNRFDFSGVDKDILKDVYQRYLPKDERKRLGEFYTPDEVITYILDTVGYKPSADIENDYLLDPACGSGSFLVEATRRLIRRYETKGFNLKDPDMALQTLEGIINHIHGLDINPFACFIAEMNMLFHVVELYGAVRKKYRDYKLSRFNIYSTDSLMPPLTEEQKQRMQLEIIKTTNSRAKYFIEETIKAEEVKGKKFDFVAGNPPYIRTLRWYDPSVAEYYRRTYESAYWNFDLYVLFIERGLKWLKDKGTLGFICSNQFMTRRYGKRLRAFLSENYAVDQIIDFGDSGVFKDVTNYPCILILGKRKPEGKIKSIRVTKSKPNILKDIKLHLDEDGYTNLNYSIFWVNQKYLSDRIWTLAPIYEESVLESIENNSNYALNKICDVISGMRIGKDALFIVHKMKEINGELVEVLPTGYEKEGKTFVVEKELLRPILKGRNVRKWIAKWQDLYVIFPHKKEDSKVVTIPDKEMKEKYPNAYEYFTAHKDTLNERIWFDKTPTELHGTWYAIMYTDSPEIYEMPKILSPALTNKNNFAFDAGKYYFVGGTAGVLGILAKETDALYLLGLLNSKLYEYYLKHKTPVKSGGYYQYSADILKKLPLKLPSNEKEKEIAEKIKNGVSKILELKEQLSEIEIRIKKFPDSYFKNVENHKKLASLVKSLTKFSKDIYKFTKKNLKIKVIKELTGEEAYRLYVSKDEYMVFRSIEEAKYVQRLLMKKGKVAKIELLILGIPLEDELKRILNENQEDIKKAKENKEMINNLENKVNELMYGLYGLTNDDMEVVEDYLSKF